VGEVGVTDPALWLLVTPETRTSRCNWNAELASSRWCRNTISIEICVWKRNITKREVRVWRENAALAFADGTRSSRLGLKRDLRVWRKARVWDFVISNFLTSYTTGIQLRLGGGDGGGSILLCFLKPQKLTP